MQDGVEQALIAYGLQQLARMTQEEARDLADRIPGGGRQAEVDWTEYEGLLRGGHPAEPEEALTCIFSLVRDTRNDDGSLPSPRYCRPQALSLSSKDGDSVLFPTSLDEARGPGSCLWTGFRAEFEQIPHTEIAPFFEAFYHLYLKYAWAVPCTYGEQGVSLFEQWKAVAALVFASDGQATPASEFTLIGGDIPGIQTFVYTITSKGAAKGLRGRSFFLQLLGDAVVRRLVADLGLCPANVIYAAGGNFMILGPPLSAQVLGQSVRERLEVFQEAVDGALLDEIAGDLALALAWKTVGADEIGQPAFGREVCKGVRKGVAARKGQLFARIAASRRKDVFGPQGKPGNRYCAICHRPLGRDEGIPMQEAPEPGTGEAARRCEVCDGFQRLAERIAGARVLAIGTTGKPPAAGQRWQEALWRVAGRWYDFDPLQDAHLAPGTFLYAINHTDFLAQGAHGFTLMASVTPRVTGADVARWKRRRDESGEEADEEPRVGAIRTFGQMAQVARGAKRIGVLRMDVDDLGQIVGGGLEGPTMARVSALSAALDRFFAGRLNAICQEVNARHPEAGAGEDRGDRLYVIYSGGDDLFVVGSWDLLPELAEWVHDEFADWAGHNPAVHISGGITVEAPGAPLYQMARRAGGAEHQAKSHVRSGARKDAISFFGMAFKWDEWLRVREQRCQVEKLVESGEAPRALIQILLDIYGQFDAQFRERYRRRQASGDLETSGVPDEIYYGPWMWRQAYALSRMAARAKEEKVKEAVLALQTEAISPEEIRYVGLAARWAELLTRKEGTGG